MSHAHLQDMEALTSETVTKFTDSAIGARGIDAMYLTQNNVTTASYTLYDAHGNMSATLSANGGTYTVTNKRTLDAWGVVRSGSGPAGSYCANLGHRQDDESGFLYVRARFYVPLEGRFGSEDRERSGSNWYAYGRNDPVNYIDRSGNDPLSAMWCGLAAFLISSVMLWAKTNNLGKGILAGIVSGVAAAIIASVSNAIGKAEEMSALQIAGMKMFGGGFVNAVGQLFVDLITGDTPGWDLLGAFGLGAAGGLPQMGALDDLALGIFCGGGGNAINNDWASLFRK